MSFKLDIKSSTAAALQTSLQTALADKGYSSADDPVMAEYIVVMLANQKLPDQITAELQDLIGSEYDPEFTAWLWSEAERLAASTSVSVSAEVPDTASTSAFAGPSEPTQRQPRRRSRSRSPAQPTRRSLSPETRQRASRGDHWSAADREASREERHDGEQPRNGRAFWQRRPNRERELFTSAVKQATRNRPHALVMDSTESPPDRPRPMRIQGIAQQQAHQHQNGIAPSILSRVGVPDPRASEFVPRTESPSILSRIDPMVPHNEPPVLPESDGPQEFPTAPSETALCRWNLKCTNPMCIYSHASPSNAGPNGDENALVLSNEPCRFGAGCTNRECTRSHVSPAIAFKTGTAQPACRFQQACTNVSCPYAHFDANGKPVPSPALTSAASTRLSTAPSDENMDDGDDVHIQTDAEPGAATADGKPAALDRALGDGAAKPCRFGTACTRKDCYFSHPPGRGAGGAIGGTPCRFGLGCTRADCYYSHPPGRRLAEAGAPLHMSNRLSRFADEGEMETIIPGQS